jgi:hypothetical protein
MSLADADDEGNAAAWEAAVAREDLAAVRTALRDGTATAIVTAAHLEAAMGTGNTELFALLLLLSAHRRWSDLSCWRETLHYSRMYYNRLFLFPLRKKTSSCTCSFPQTAQRPNIGRTTG